MKSKKKMSQNTKKEDRPMTLREYKLFVEYRHKDTWHNKQIERDYQGYLKRYKIYGKK